MRGRLWNVSAGALTDIEVDSSVLECEGEPCLFVNSRG